MGGGASGVSSGGPLGPRAAHLCPGVLSAGPHQNHMDIVCRGEAPGITVTGLALGGHDVDILQRRSKGRVRPGVSHPGQQPAWGHTACGRRRCPTQVPLGAEVQGHWPGCPLDSTTVTYPDCLGRAVTRFVCLEERAAAELRTPPALLHRPFGS